MTHKEVATPKFSDFLPVFSRGKSAALADITLVGSGKGAIATVLEHLIQRGIVKSKIDEMLVPDWLGYWVYNQMQSYVFPGKTFSNRTRAIFVYHQYGFPQNMKKIMEYAHDKKLIVIEDCAHAVHSFYEGKRVGWFGDYSIFSFSKWLFCFSLGGVRGTDPDFAIFTRNLTIQTPLGLTALKNLAKLIFELTGKTGFLKMTFALYGQALKGGFLGEGLVTRNLDREIDLRQKRFQYFLEKTKHLGICEHLPTKGVTPYVIPIIPQSSRIERVVQGLLDHKIKTAIYQFDVNRNMLDPNFVPCVWVPVHGGMSDNQFDLIIETVKKNV